MSYGVNNLTDSQKIKEGSSEPNSALENEKHSMIRNHYFMVKLRAGILMSNHRDTEGLK